MEKLSFLLAIGYFIFGLDSFCQAADGSCRIVPRTDVPHANQPLYLQGEGLALPARDRRGDGIIVENGGTIAFACPGSGNYVLSGNRDVVEIGTCIGGTVFSLGRQEVTVDRITCSKQVKATLKAKKQSCGRSAGQIYDVGFQVLSKWYRLFEICFDVKGQKTVYSHHVVYSLQHSIDEKNSKRPSFLVGAKELHKGYSASHIYEKDEQEKVFKEIFPSSNYWDSCKLNLNKGHLAPDGDFMFTNWQWATYFYSNVAPQWSSINAGNWRRLESQVRELANRMGRDLEVWTGPSGVLQLLEKDEMRAVRLGDPPPNGIFVPLYFWKLVLDPVTGEAVVFVSENDPHLEVERPPPCRDVCSRYSWTFKNDPNAGLIYCCEMRDELRYVLPGLPDVRPAGVLPWM